MMEKLKPVILLKPEEKQVYREQILNILKVIEKKVTSLNEKKDGKKDTRKRQANIDFFKFHQNKLSMLSEWLLSPSRKFSL